MLHQHIQFEMTPPYTPKYNGVAEQSSQMVMEMVHAMLKGVHMPCMLWAEALAYMTTIINYTPTSTNSSMSPYKRWTGQ